MTSDTGHTSSDPLVGSVLADRYEVKERIGAGAMGAVYRAVQSGLGREVALKVLKRDLTWGGDTVARFRREAKAMSSLRHPNTVQVYDFGATEDGQLFLAMELLRGELATERVQRGGRMALHDAITYCQQVLRSIREAHEQGIIHRDLKPDNIFLATPAGHEHGPPVVKVLDFGIAKAIEGENKLDQFETQDGTVFGTPRYMSPEQAQGRRLDHRSDLYAVGIMLYEFLTGAPPFVDPDAVIVMAKHIRERPAPLSKQAPDRVFPPRLEQVLQRALAKVPEQRFGSAAEFEAALDECLDDALMMDRFGKGKAGRVLKAVWLDRRVRYGGLGLLAAALGLWLSTGAPDTDGPVPSDSAPGLADVSDDDAAPGPRGGERSPATLTVTVGSVPTGADVWRDGEVVGVTPLDIPVLAGGFVPVRVSKPGFEEVTLQLDANNRSPVVALSATAPPTAEATEADEAAPAAPAAAPGTTTADGDAEAAAAAAARKRQRARRKRLARQRRMKQRTAAKPASPYEKF